MVQSRPLNYDSSSNLGRYVITARRVLWSQSAERTDRGQRGSRTAAAAAAAVIVAVGASKPHRILL